MSTEESEKVFEMVSGKYERNPRVDTKDMVKKLAWLKKRRDWATNGLYPESRQPLIEKFVAQWRPDEMCIKNE